MRKVRKVKLNILIAIVAVLLCATLFSMHLVGGLYARYTTKLSGSDGARVASFKITQEGTIFQTIEANVTPGETQYATLKITNNSEVSVEYTVKVTNVTGNIEPLRFKLEPSNATTAVTTEYNNGVSTNKILRSPGDWTDEFTLSIVWEPSADPNVDLALVGMVDYITVSVAVTQVD